MKTVIVTGAAGNLGQVVVKKFLDEGFQVTGTVTSEKRNLFPDYTGFKQVPVDLTNETAAHQFVADIIMTSPQIDIAVLTAGGFAMGKIEDSSASDLLHQYKLNFETAYNVARPIFAQMMKQGTGRIFLIGSRPGLDMHNSKGMVGYGLAKSLIFRLAELMNDEAKGHDIVTTVIVPSTIDTPPNRQAMPDADFNKWVKPETIADIIHIYSGPATATLRQPVIKIYNNA